MINIAKLLEDAPKGMKLYSPLFGEVEFAEVMDTSYMPIRVMKRGYGLRFDKYGRYMGSEYPDAECLLFPSKDYRTWQGWTPCVEPKFKVGDWITNGTFTHYIVSIVDGFYYFYGGGYLDFGKIDGYYHLWTIADAKNGDVLVSGIDNPFIYNGNNEFSSVGAYIGISRNGMIKLDMFPSRCWTSATDVKPATKEQRDMLFKKIKEAGYQWDADKKELHKIKHYDISSFYAGMPVLVRPDNDCCWDYSVFSRNTGNEYWHFAVCNGVSFTQCIPFNDDTKHLLGTTDMCDECYINW